jgi:hypothetical protein
VNYKFQKVYIELGEENKFYEFHDDMELPPSNFFAIEKLEITALSENQFYVDREGFSLWSLLTSPMILMGVVMMGMMYVMPKMMEGLGSFCNFNLF